MLLIKRALISVWDKTGVVDFARVLLKYGVELISTGGTHKAFLEAGIHATEVSALTQFPEILNGRVKTLSPFIFSGILADKEQKGHIAQLSEQRMKPIDLVVVNLYPFEKMRTSGLSEEKLIEYIDIGGPAMLRAAAKNFKSVAAVSSPRQYPEVIQELNRNKGCLNREFLKQLACAVFAATSCYEREIYNYFSGTQQFSFSFRAKNELRYGENPHQKGFLLSGGSAGEVSFAKLQGKELSFNNLLDLDSTLKIVRQFSNPAAVVVKHGNPCGACEGDNPKTAYRKAYQADALASFGGIVGINRSVGGECAREIIKSGFREVILAPSFSKEALRVFAQKKNLRIVSADFQKCADSYDIKKTEFGVLIQEPDIKIQNLADFRCVTRRKPTKKQLQDLLFAWQVVQFVKSNAIVLAKNRCTCGIGMGLVSRVDAVRLAISKSQRSLSGAVLASDAFLPKEDNVKFAHKAGISAIVQPGGSIEDEKIISACNAYGIAMVFTGVRHFRH